MKFFIDTANVEDIKKANDMGQKILLVALNKFVVL